ncbi:GGDEF domain-containing protein [Ruminococcaceae bacterium OttesenSCG-928-D13]|nr:GGDEF domain-containing protein [Ruminococcaceae bacterium OttesenSCG-928-D13]
MRRFISFARRHLDSWEEICINDSARLRLNLILFSFVITVVFLIMSIRTSVALGLPSALPTMVCGATTLTLFLWQFNRREYSAVIAWLFGLMSLAMATFFIAFGGFDGTGHVWICILPIVGTMMVSFRHTFLYNGLLLVLLFCLFRSPLYNLIPAEYAPYMRVVFPISILILTLCNYVSEFTRQRLQKQLIVMTEKFRNSAYTDPLTGVYNRRALIAHFGEADALAHGLSFAMLDLDFFKKVNDTYGHEIGDMLLCHLVLLVKKRMPSGAQLYRWGGEEFLLVLKSGDMAHLRDVLDSIRKEVAETPLVLPAQEGGSPMLLTTTVSIGGMVAASQDSIETSISQADAQMYLAKKAGRNRVMIKSPADG